MSEETRTRLADASRAFVEHLKHFVELRDSLLAQFKSWTPLDSENPRRIKEVRQSVTELRQTVADLGRAYQPAEDAYDQASEDGGIQSVGDVAVFRESRSDAYRAVIDTVWLTLNTFRVQTFSPDPPQFPFALLGLHGVRRVEDPFVELITPDQIEYQLEATVRIGLTAGEVRALEKALDRQLQADDLDSVPTVTGIRCEHTKAATERRKRRAGVTRPPGPQPRATETALTRANHERIVAFLTAHHKYDDVSVLNTTPIGVRAMSRQLAGTPSPAEVSRWFGKHCGGNEKRKGHDRYKLLCRDAGNLADWLKTLRGEFASAVAISRTDLIAAESEEPHEGEE